MRSATVYLNPPPVNFVGAGFTNHVCCVGAGFTNLVWCVGAGFTNLVCARLQFI